MITKGNDTKVQNEVIAQTITDETAKRLKACKTLSKTRNQRKFRLLHLLQTKH